MLPWIAFGAVLALGAAFWPFTVDDAFVLARYASRIARGAGYTMDDGPPTDGVTGPLGLVPAVIGALVFGQPVLASKATGLAAAGLAAALVVRRAARASMTHGWVTLLLTTSGATLAVWGGGGLETGLATLAVTLLGLAMLGPPEGAEAGWGCRGVVAGLAIFALAWLRPELALASGVLLVALIRRARPAGLVALGIGALGLVSIVLFRIALFGEPLPLSAQAKPADLGNGAEYALRASLIALGGGGLIAAWLGAREGGAGERALFAALLAHLLALVLAGGDWMPGFRLLAPMLPLYAWLAARPIATRLTRRSGRLCGAALFAGCALLPLGDAALQLPAIRASGEARREGGVELADWLAANATRVAMVDVGYVAYRSGVEVVDLGGITDPRIGRLPGGHLDKRIDPGVLRALAPDAIVLHSSAPPRVDAEGRLRALAGYPVERRVAEMAWVRAEMRVVRVVAYAPHYYYVVLTARP